MNIVFVLSAHTSQDERVNFQQAETLRKADINTSIITSNHKTAKEAIRHLALQLQNTKPDIIICDTPVAILAALRYRRSKFTIQNSQLTGHNSKFATNNSHTSLRKPQIVYDITEYYPSKKNLRGLSPLKRIFKFLLLTVISFYTSLFVKAFIFGEHYKAIPFRRLFFWKKYIYLPYYTHTSTVACYPARNLQRECIFFYAGNLTVEKGFYNVLNIVNKCAHTMPDTKFTLRILSKDNLPIRNSSVPHHVIQTCETPSAAHPTSHISQCTIPQNLTIAHKPILPFEQFLTEIGKADIFFDLRKIDFENNRCLPIKLFYYIAAGRPVIYSNLKAIRKEIPDISNFGTLINPASTANAVAVVQNYINNYELYTAHCNNARKAAEQKYNWTFYEEKYINFITAL